MASGDLRYQSRWNGNYTLFIVILTYEAERLDSEIIGGTYSLFYISSTIHGDQNTYSYWLQLEESKKSTRYNFLAPPTSKESSGMSEDYPSMSQSGSV